MPFNLLLLPLVGGYFFLDRWQLTQFYLSRVQGNRLIIWAAVPATILAAVSVVITYLGSIYFPDIRWTWTKVVPFAYSGTSLIALVLGFCLPPILNLLVDSDKYTQKIIERHASEMEKFLNDAMNEFRQVAFTLRNNKVYVGWITSVFSSASMLEDQQRYLKILPFFSGYVDETTKELNLTTSYIPIYDLVRPDEDGQDPPSPAEDMARPRFEHLTRNDFEKIISAYDIMTVFNFDVDVYEEFQNLPRE